MARRKKANKKNKYKARRILFVILILLVLAIAGYLGNMFSNLSKVKTVKITETKEALEVSDKAVEKSNEYDVINFAFFGIDSRESGETARSDSIMIATIDKEHNKIKLSSIMRDTYVSISGHDKDKITHAYAYGGPQLAVSTLNKNFDLNIKYFVTVDFFDMEKIIDTLGGVEIDVKKDEIDLINGYSVETSTISKTKRKLVTKSGLQVLNGMQAVSYTRIRYTAGGDFVRTERQRTVLTALLNKIASMDKAKFATIVPTLAQYVETNLGATDMLSIGIDALQAGISNIDQERFPIDGNAFDKKINGIYYLTTDLDLTTEQIHDYIYEDIKPVMDTKK
ncbi:LCP family protein [Clostridium grantii]|uniref:Transcriptional attenuator, LytR family n=1 Tax=Clostridium grantii DSM 8605 TaxID=1121316 RepID=A0A1M5RKI3_9CLOT|nr:LCP family protein [Clostridium grantii]SHH26598.1 transcriptional attenuator, LytR family [Clostridium grantii DSM 8605]